MKRLYEQKEQKEYELEENTLMESLWYEAHPRGRDWLYVEATVR